MVMKSVCTLQDEEQAKSAADSLETAGCETELVENKDGSWTVRSDGMFVTRTAMEKF